MPSVGSNFGKVLMASKAFRDSNVQAANERESKASLILITL